MKNIPRPPSYRRHKASGQAIVVIRGKTFYLGAWKSPASHAAYKRIIDEHWTVEAPAPLRPVETAPALCLLIDELILAYWQRHVSTYYVKNGKPTSEQDNIHQALRFLRRLYGQTLARGFGPLDLKAVRQAMIDARRCRTLINKDVHRVRAMFRWAVGEGLYPGELLANLTAVEALKKNRSTAKELPPVEPVPEEVVLKTLPHLSPQVGAMVRLQLLTAARPGEVTIIRPRDVDRTDPACWVYRPDSHKTEHHGRDRVILIGPRGQEVLRPWLDRDPDAYCFSPTEVVAARRKRDSPDTMKTKSKSGERPARPRPGGRYTKDSYRVAIQRACRRAKVPVWTPHRLRHTRATAIRHEFDIDAAQIILGHSQPDTTSIYAERNLAKGRAVMAQIG